jgi:hypothetical protein
MICDKCKNEVHVVYFEKESKKWLCEKHTPYLKKEKKDTKNENRKDK